MNKINKFSKVLIAIGTLSLTLTGCKGTDATSGNDGRKNTYVISFDSNGGSAINSVEVKEGELLPKPNDPIRKGFDFEGWYKNRNLTTIYDFSSPVYSSFILYAGWAEAVPDVWTVNFVSDGKTISTQEVLDGECLAEPNNPAKDGYEFAGWYKSGASERFDFDTPVTSSFDLYAKWLTQEYMVIFNLNYDNLPAVEYPTENGLVTFVPERNGYVFNGWWYCDGIINGMPILNRSFSMNTRVISDGLELFAEWIEQKEYSNQLDTPVVTIDDYLISWSSVDNATAYQIVITAIVKGVTQTFVDTRISQSSYAFDQSLEANTYTVKVRSIGDGINYRNSAYATKTLAHKVLTSVRNFSYNEFKCMLQWDEVKYATGYTILIDGLQQLELSNCFYDFTAYSAGSHTIRVTATRSGWVSSTGTYAFVKWYLNAPINLSATFNESTKAFDIRWDAVAKADTYRLYINDNLCLSSSTNKYSLQRDSSYFVDETIEFAVEAFDSSGEYFLSPKSESISLSKIYLISYDLNGGTNNSQNVDRYTAKDNITLYNPTRLGYTFMGWTNGDSLITEIPTGSSGDITLTANWSVNTYEVVLDANGGACSDSFFEITYGSSYSLPIPTRAGYTFDGWYNGLAKVDQSGTWNYDSDITLTARWNPITYTITYNLNGGTNASSNPSTYNVESPTISLANPTKTGYTFTGWTSGSSSIASIPTGTTGDLTLTANWSANTYNVSIVINNDSLGSVSGAGSYDYGGSVTLAAIPTDDNVFWGWYSDSGFTTNLLSHSNPYIFNLENEGLTIYAKFLTKAEEEAEPWNIAHGVIPTLSEDGNTITYGLYPQTHVNNSSLVSSLNALTTPESNGWYFYNNEYYAKVSATPYGSYYKFDDGTYIVRGTTYWFKCKPIIWDVLSNNDGEYYILSSVLLDAHCYYNSTENRTIGGKTIYPNNYEYSDIRTWLNSDFYNSVFALNDSYIQTTTVDNSAAGSSYACNNTQDKVFLPSYRDYSNSDYGFSTSIGSTSTRYCKTTDWARARGARPSTDSSYLYNGYYWTRSPYSVGSDYAWRVTYDGSLDSYYGVNRTSYGVRPAITISIT